MLAKQHLLALELVAQLRIDRNGWKTVSTLPLRHQGAADSRPCQARGADGRAGLPVGRQAKRLADRRGDEAEEISIWLSQPIRQITTDRPDVALAQRDKGN